MPELLFMLGVIAAALGALAQLARHRRRRHTIAGMLTDQRPYATRRDAA